MLLWVYSPNHPSHFNQFIQSLHVDAFLWVSTCYLTLPLSCGAFCCAFTCELCYFFFFFISLSSFFKINIYRYRLSVCEVSLQEFPVWGPRPLTRLNLPFQMKAALRETVLFGRAAEPCLQTAGMWDVWSGGQEARKECQVCPCLSRAGSPFSSQWRAPRASEYKGSSTLQSELRSTPLPKLNSSFHQENERKGKEEGKDCDRSSRETLRTRQTRQEINLIRKRFLRLELWD